MHNWTKLQLLGAVPGQREIFEEICRKIIHAEHPLARTIREDPGDNGIDFFVEYSEGNLEVYQAKFFRDKIDDSQQGQIRSSFSRVLGLNRIATWTLMVPLELSFDEWAWFTTWRDKQRIPINLLSGLQLEAKLMQPGYEEALKVLSDALHVAGLELHKVEAGPLLAVCLGTERHRRDEFESDSLNPAFADLEALTLPYREEGATQAWNSAIELLASIRNRVDKLNGGLTAETEITTNMKQAFLVVHAPLFEMEVEYWRLSKTETSGALLGVGYRCLACSDLQLELSTSDVYLPTFTFDGDLVWTSRKTQAVRRTPEMAEHLLTQFVDFLNREYRREK
jgi:hypothetical protein